VENALAPKRQSGERSRASRYCEAWSGWVAGLAANNGHNQAFLDQSQPDAYFEDSRPVISVSFGPRTSSARSSFALTAEFDPPADASDGRGRQAIAAQRSFRFGLGLDTSASSHMRRCSRFNRSHCVARLRMASTKCALVRPRSPRGRPHARYRTRSGRKARVFRAASHDRHRDVQGRRPANAANKVLCEMVSPIIVRRRADVAEQQAGL